MPDRLLSDDFSILADDVLFRGLVRDWIVPGDRGRMRIASAAFKSEELSVIIQSLLRAQGRNEADALAACPGVSLCSITVALASELGQVVTPDTAPPNDPAHGLVLGKKTKSVANRFAREAAWVIPVEPPPITG